MKLFFITVLDNEGLRKRTWGWYEKFEDAENVVVNNLTDIFERGYYDLAVIEEMPEGILTFAENEFWYRAIYQPEATEPKVEKILKPFIFEKMLNFAY